MRVIGTQSTGPRDAGQNQDLDIKQRYSRPRFCVTFEAADHGEHDPTVDLRRLLKLAGRRFSLRCIEVKRLPDDGDVSDASRYRIGDKTGGDA